MTWFKVDDSFHSHPKVLAAAPAALGLWVIAGSWCSANPSDGFVPDYVLLRLLPGSVELAEQLVSCGLWRRTRGGYRFHDWSDYQPTRDELAATKQRKSSGGALGNHRRWHTSTGRVDPNCAFCQQKPAPDNRSPSDGRTDRVPETSPSPPGPSRPDPIKRGVRPVDNSRPREPEEPPPPRCDRHINDPDPPACGRCGDARRHREAWDRGEATRRATEARDAPRCRTHPGEVADTCRGCRADAIAAKTGSFPLIVPRQR
jgi:hypothetical protein